MQQNILTVSAGVTVCAPHADLWQLAVLLQLLRQRLLVAHSPVLVKRGCDRVQQLNQHKHLQHCRQRLTRERSINSALFASNQGGTSTLLSGVVHTCMYCASNHNLCMSQHSNCSVCP